MIIVNLTGGLGNQLFQYATAKRLSHKCRGELKLHFTNALLGTPRKYELNCFNIATKTATNLEVSHMGFPTSKFGRLLFRVAKYTHLNNLFYPRVLTDDIININQDVLNRNQCNCYLEGYWQNEIYFKDIRQELLTEFSFVSKINNINKKISELIKNTNSVSVHVRRGDYLTNKQANDTFVKLPISYYQKAADIIKATTKDPYFFVFSDDINWAKDNLHINRNTYYVADYAGKKDYEDMQLMTYCKHNIIANSSFSWWGAWLGKNEGKKVICPVRWFLDPKYKNTNPSCSKWQKI